MVAAKNAPKNKLIRVSIRGQSCDWFMALDLAGKMRRAARIVTSATVSLTHPQAGEGQV
ncbi:hypothetical protein NBRC116597_20810 [Phaeobacter sp. NW0010-22]